ncbi:family 78 glycoside hydrolase catalytic domain [bacterium]|nr:family 78 glycoside hydrolase catalytic domain [bacterium]
MDEPPVHIEQLNDGTHLIDFGRVAFGNVMLHPPSETTGELRLHFGEAMKDGCVDRKPPGTVRYKQTTITLAEAKPTLAAPKKDGRNTRIDHPTTPPAILTPEEWGVILPFRWLEIEGWSGELKPEHIVRKAAYSATWDDDAASFECSDELLNRIWELCRYSIKATTFVGVYVDGDRERIPYEADAYLNQLSHYYTDNDIQTARDTVAHLFKHPTWPTEWAPHMVFMVHADWMHTGDKEWMAIYYEQLKEKTLAHRRGADGLIASSEQDIKRTDIVDWPKGERDDYVFTSRNTVVNAFYLEAIRIMGELAKALGKEDESRQFQTDYKSSHAVFQSIFFDTDRQLYVDGIETDHSSAHANFFPLAFDLVPENAREPISQWLAKRGMRCSVYAAQYLMEALFENGAEAETLNMITANNDRSWRHMLESGTTITWEAWDQKYKPNQDWNHAWGAAPANLLPRYILGAEALQPGWKTVRIRPHLAGLSFAKGKVPTPRGPVHIEWGHSKSFKLTLNLPEATSAQVELPTLEKNSKVYHNGQVADVQRIAERWVLMCESGGIHQFEVK